MVELTERELQAIQETHDIVIEIKTVLLGKNGDEGLCGDVKYLQKDHARLKQTVGILIGVLAGSGVITGATWGILRVLGA